MEMPPVTPPTGPETNTPHSANPSTKPANQPDEGNPKLVAMLNTIELDDDAIQEWWERIEKAEKRVKDREAQWDALMEAYTPNVSKTGDPEDVKSNAHFRNTHTKIGQIFVRSPQVILSPRGPSTDMIPVADPMTGVTTMVQPSEAVPIRQAVINEYMGPDHIDGLTLMDECAMDMMQYSGIAAVQLSYYATKRTINKPRMQPDPNFIPQQQPGSIMNLAPQPAPMVPVMQPDPETGQQVPVTDPVEVVIHESVCADRIDARKVLIDELLNSPRVAKLGRWVGCRFSIAPREAKRKFGLSDEEIERSRSGKDDRTYRPKEDGQGDETKDLILGYRVWYKACFFTDEDHPDAINELVLLDLHKQEKKTCVSRPSPDQTFDDRHQLTPDSIIGFPLKIGSLRVLNSSPFAQADAAFTNALVKQLDTHLQQGVKMRDAAIGKYFYDTDAIDEDDLNLMRNGGVGEYIGMKAGAGAQGWDKIFFTTAQVKRTPDDYKSAQEIDHRMNDTLGISPVESGAGFETVRSATEVNKSSSGSQGRMEKERNRFVAFYLEIVAGVDAYIFRYFTGTRYVEVAGEDGSKTLKMWNKRVGAGRYAYEIKMDSQLSQTDVGRDRQQKLTAYTTLAPDPLFNRAPVVREIARDFGWDPSKVVHAPEVIQAQQAAQAAGAPGPPQAAPYAGKGGGPSGPPGGQAHMMEKSGRTENSPGSSGPGDNRQDRNPRPGGKP